MAVSIDEARHAARLARLALSDEELEAIAADLSDVLDHFESVEGFASTELASGNAAIADDVRGSRPRPDEVGAMLPRSEALRNAPASEDGQFAVPGFLPDEP